MSRPFPFLGVNQTMIDMIVDQGTLRAADRILNGLELLRDIDAWPFFLDHRDDALQMTGSSIEPLDNRWVTGMGFVGHLPLSHAVRGMSRNIPPGG